MSMKKLSRTIATHGTCKKSQIDIVKNWLKFNEMHVMHFNIEYHQYYKCRPWYSIVIWVDNILVAHSFDILILKLKGGLPPDPPA